MTARLLSEHSVTSLDVVHHADALAWLRGAPSNWLNCVVTSPPYFQQRDYGVEGQIGLEDTPERYVERLVTVFRELRRVLRPDGVAWLNLGDSFLPGKQLAGIPWRVALALQSDGWILRSDCIWHKPNPMPSSVTDRPTSAHEYLFLLARSERYFYDADAIAEPSIYAGKAVSLGEKSLSRGQATGAGVRASGNATAASVTVTPTRNKRSVWTVATEQTPFAHFATFPQALIEPMVLAGCPAQVCAACGAPYERVVEREPADMTARYLRGEPVRHGHAGASQSGASNVGAYSGQRRTLGFAPTCSCAAGTRPGIVYDPFMGSGTTGLVAQRLGRHYIGTDINREYVELARRRVQYRGDDRRMMQEQDAGVEQMALFEHTAA